MVFPNENYALPNIIFYLHLTMPFNYSHFCRTVKFHVVISSNVAKQAKKVQIHEYESGKVLTDLAQRFEFTFKTKFQNLL